MTFALSAGLLSAQAWTLKDSGVGLVVQDGDYDKQLKIAQRANDFDLEDLYAKGALAGKYNGNQVFAAWLVGPHTDTYRNKYGTPIWMYKYTVTYPSGKTFEGGPGGFYTPGFTVVSLGVGGETSGKWKIDWSIVNRDTNEVRHVATNEFTTTWGKPAAAAEGDWKLVDMGVGLVVQDGDYDKQLKIARRGDSFDLQDLYAKGALAGKYNGNQAFAAWLVGPHTDTYRNKYGTPIWMYKYTVTYPGGKTFEGGPGGFYTPGFTVVSLSVGGDTSGKWRIDWSIVNRDTQEVRRVGTIEFTTTW
jgi:hypothetical protein